MLATGWRPRELCRVPAAGQGLIPVLLVWAWMCCRTRWMSSGLVRSISSSVSLDEQLLRSSWAPGLCGSNTLANTRKPMESKCRAVACPKPESQPVRTKRNPAVAGDSHQPLSPAPRVPPQTLPLHPQGPKALPWHQSPCSSSQPARDMTLLWGTCRSWSCCFLSLWHRGGRKHSLICNPITLGASPVQGADKTAGTVRHWDSPEFSSDAGQEASPPQNIL